MQNGSFCILKILQRSGPVIIIYNYVLPVTTTPKYGSCLFLYRCVTFYTCEYCTGTEGGQAILWSAVFLLTRKTTGKKIENKQLKPKVHDWDIK